MPLLGEAPITVYMQKQYRASNGADASDSKPPLKKRKISEPERLKDTKCDVKVFRGKATIIDYFGQANASTEPNTGIQTLNLLTPKLSHKRTRKTDNVQEPLQTSHMTNEGPSRLRKSVLATSKPTPSSTKPLEQITSGRRSDFCPTHLTMTHHSLHIHNFQQDDEIPCKRIGGHHRLAAANPAPELLSQHVLSSQTQPELILKITNAPMQAHSPRKSSHFCLNTGQDRYPPSSVDDTDPLIVESSQSQPPLSIPGHITKHMIDIPRNDGHRLEIDPIPFECIPSSQSQEIELTISKDEADNGTSDCRMPSPQYVRLCLIFS